MTHSEILWQGITALVTILTIVAAYLKTRSAGKAAHVETTQKIDHVQTTVNGQTEALHSRVEQLTSSLTDSGVIVPKSGAASPPPSDAA